MDSIKVDRLVVGYDLCEDGHSYSAVVIASFSEVGVDTKRIDRVVSRREMLEFTVEAVRRHKPSALFVRIGNSETEYPISRQTTQDIAEGKLGVDDLLVGVEKETRR